jgi:hypothetical protein
MFMRCLDRLPSVRLNRRCQLPDCPGIYFLVVGSSIYYVGKALSIRQRHSSESNHEIYSHLNQARPSLRELFHIKWIEFTNISIPGYLLDELLLGYENYMIKTLYPPWNRRQNSIELSDAIVYSINNKILSIYLPKSIERMIDPSTSSYTASQLNHQSTSQYHDDVLLALAKKRHAERKNNGKVFNQINWNMKDNIEIQELVSNINSCSKKEVPPADLILLGLTLLAKEVNQYGSLMDINEKDLSILEKFRPETSLHPQLLKIAETFLEIYPNMTLDELISRCMNCSTDYICPLDWAELKRIYTNHNDTLAVPVTETNLKQLDQNSVSKTLN